jgi:hypothetical protein
MPGFRLSYLPTAGRIEGLPNTTPRVSVYLIMAETLEAVDDLAEEGALREGLDAVVERAASPSTMKM